MKQIEQIKTFIEQNIGGRNTIRIDFFEMNLKEWEKLQAVLESMAKTNPRFTYSNMYDYGNTEVEVYKAVMRSVTTILELMGIEENVAITMFNRKRKSQERTDQQTLLVRCYPSAKQKYNAKYLTN